ncbi:MAG: DUF3616 domain-containing protein [Myxococcota bacterium]|nr:DUF3616 domain-containing protein [Myxococcota bacterium]
MKREQIPLRFRADAGEISRQLSSVVQCGDDLLLGSDEGCTVERLSPDGDGYAHHESFGLAKYLDLPREDEEVDIEGLEHADGYLWIAGSHSARRKRPHDDDEVDDAFDALATVEHAGNRYLLARVPLVQTAGHPRLERTAPALENEPERHAARVGGGRRRNRLIDRLRDDRHLAPFLDLPGKDNGFDVEGFAVGDERVYLGLRGPVLRGHAIVLAIAPRCRKRRPERLRLAKLEHGARYEKHFLALRGLGIRELCVDGRDLLVLAGPTMVLDGRTAVFRWRDALDVRGDSIIKEDQLERVLELEPGKQDDHPEGIALIRHRGRRGLLVIYDAPSEARCPGPDTVLADFYPL